MNPLDILYPVLALAGLGVVFGILLGIAAKAFRVEQDERVPRITEVLPGANCGGCGYAGCSAFAQAVVDGEAKANGCPVGGAAVGAQVAAIMGVTLEQEERKVARVLCSGTREVTTTKYRYDGIRDCNAAYRYGGGEKTCLYGCSGYGSCVRACAFDAIHVVDGVARVDADKCTACGKCVAACPKRLIELVPESQKTVVLCRSREKGAAIRDICQAGCIGCKICEKNCPTGAITVVDNIARIDYDKCTNCGICAAKCPKHVIAGRADTDASQAAQ